ncbi:DUF1349 domain-containing protein [Stecheria sp. CLA-KB-P133]|uniref:DUF1349 domain-containing protein n=1 Tax=Grylomicrobium aquisgranensis TaxID=2926318 RepID=A0AB35U3C4_9FIRM|nr:DUF1349 domain-containing protein [Stecheria sp. CLA-KB-P133]
MEETLKWEWTRKPADFSIDSGRIEITTQPHTDLWQRTYYHFQNDNAPCCRWRQKKSIFRLW